jgi:hypothetical protein
MNVNDAFLRIKKHYYIFGNKYIPMSKKILIYLISPTHVISSISAISTMYGNQKVEAIILVHWPGVNNDINKELMKIISELSNNYNFIENIISVTSEQKQELLSKGLYRAKRLLKEIIGINKIDSILYSHDIEGGMYQFLSATYPKAKRICFGDTFGNVYEKKIHLGLLGVYQDSNVSKIKNVISFIKKLISNMISIKKIKNEELFLKEFSPHAAVLILPVDQSGYFLKNIPLYICKKEVFISVVNKCIFNTVDLIQYIMSLVEKYNAYEKYILLTENLAEGNFIDFDREIDMWCSIINKNCKPGSVVFLKSHPGETLPRNEEILKRIGTQYEIVELDKRFKRYPIEIWRDLVLNCRIICMSYAVLSLKYLYDIDVIQPMDKSFIEKWFPEWTWVSYKNSLSLYMEPLKRLPSWDGSSVLWAGKI